MRQHGDTKRKSGGPSVRLLRVAEQIRHLLAGILVRGEVHDDVLASHSVIVSEVRVSPDLRHATAFIRPLGGEDIQAVLTALTRHARYIKGLIGHQLHVKYTPDLVFRADESFDEAGRIETLLRDPRIARDLGSD